MASRRSHNIGAFGAASEGQGRASVLAPPAMWRVPAAANDNKAPLLLKLRRLVFFIMTAAAVFWLFWVGFLR